MKSNRHPTQWGSTQRLVGEGVPSENRVKTSARLVDVRLPTTTEGWDSRDCTLYTNAKLIDTDVIEGKPLTAAITCVLYTGMGGVTRSESFKMPGVGRAIHIVADSVRLDVSIESQYPASFDVTANVGIGGLYRHTTQKIISLFPDPGLTQYIDIPNYCTFYKLECPNPAQLTIAGAFDGTVVTPTQNGLSAVDFTPIPLIANQLYIQSTINQTCYLVLSRPS